MAQFVALVQRGMITDQKALAVGNDKEELQRKVDAAVEKLNSEQQGFGEAWVDIVLEVEA